MWRIKHNSEKFNKNVVDITSSMLLFLQLLNMIPAVFTHTFSNDLLNTKYEGLKFSSFYYNVYYIFSLIFLLLLKNFMQLNTKMKMKRQNGL